MAESTFVTGSSLLTADIDLLFEKHSVKQLHEIEQKVRFEIEKKKEDVRLMVGERYRDLIEAADTIAEMKQSISNITAHILSMEDQMSMLNRQDANQLKSENESNKLFDQYYNLACDVKLLLDIPGKIWSLIESKQILFATALFLLARHIHNSLHMQSNFGVPVTSWFPVVSRQWITIVHFKTTLNDVCKNTLKIHDVNAEVLAHCFSSLLILNNTTVPRVFEEFLQSRLDCVKEIFHPSHEESTVKYQNCQIVYLIVNTLQLTHDLFVNGSNINDENDSRLDKTLKNVFTNSNFDSRFQSKNISHHMSAVREHLPSIKYNFTVEELQDKCTDWIEKIKISVTEELAEVITFVKTIHGLSIIRDTVSDVISKNSETEKWSRVCEILLKNDLRMWEDIFEPLFLNQMKSIVDYHIKTAFLRIEKDLTRFIDESISDPRKYEVERDVSTFFWEEKPNDLPSKIYWGWNKQQTNPGSLMLKARGFTPLCQILCTHLNEDLSFLIDDITHFKGQEEKLEENVTSFVRTSTERQIEKLIKHCIKLVETEKCSGDQITMRSLAMARFLVALTELCPTLQTCIKGIQKEKFTNRRDSNASFDVNWENQRKQLVIHSNEMLRKWKKIILDEAKHKLENILTSKSLADSLLYLPLWDTIDIQEENEEGKLVSSVIRIPGQASWTLLKLIHFLCLEMNKAAPHFLPRDVLQEIQTDIFEEILSSYEKNVTAYEPINQITALQLSFDVNFISNLMSAKDDKVIATRIYKLLEFIDSHVDPFDLDVFTPHIQTNLKKCVQRSSIIFGALVNPGKTNAYLSMARTTPSQNEQHNILSTNTSAPHFSLLPLANMNLEEPKYKSKK